MIRQARHFIRLLFLVVALPLWNAANAQQATQQAPVLHGYQKAPQPISDILSARPTPLVQVSPDGKWLLAADRLLYPPVSDLAQPMLRLAGLRINPATNGRHHPPRFTGCTFTTPPASEQASYGSAQRLFESCRNGRRTASTLLLPTPRPTALNYGSARLERMREPSS